MKEKKITQDTADSECVGPKQMEADYNNPVDTANILLLPVKVKKKKVKKADDKVINRKKHEARKRRLEETEVKISKTKRKKLIKVMERKKKKESKESLLKNLMQYQLSTGTMSKLTAEIHPRKRAKPEECFVPKKLSNLAGCKCVLFPELKKQPLQENYYETGSESEDDLLLTEEVITMDAESSMCTVDGKDMERKQVEDSADRRQENLTNQNTDESKLMIKHHETINLLEPNTSELDVANLPVKISCIRNKMSLLEGAQKSNFVPVHRSESVEAQRSKLPIYAEEQSIMEAINENYATIICGETGSGKTTQLPQFLYEAGYTRDGKMIGITEPRRVAAMAMAARVAQEMNLPNAVSYQIKYEGNRSAETSILFMTDGVLMKEMQKDVMLSAYSVIVIDEAHERSMYSDVLIGLLTRIAPYRFRMGSPLKLIIMSATLRLVDFKNKRLFPISLPPVLTIDARQYPVSIHFEKRTPKNYLVAAFHKICEIHEKKGPGTILVFLSGKLEVMALLKWLVERYAIGRVEGKKLKQSQLELKKATSNQSKKAGKSADEDLADNRFADADNLDCGDPGSEISENLRPEGPCPRHSLALPLFCLPLYSLLSSKKQQRIFEPAPDGHRMCVVATNVAETSLTIPAVRYVIDSGREKRRHYDPVTGVSQFLVSWISQASADQRAGRAGRVQPGEVYRLYSSAVYSDFEKFSPPEILTKPVDQLVLHLKSMNIVKVANFPFPTPPDEDSLEEAERRLIRLGALQVAVKNNVKQARINLFGKTLSIFPLAPAFAKILVMANQHSLMTHACCLVAALSVREPLIPLYSLRGGSDRETQALMLQVLKQRRSWCPPGQARNFGDLTVIMRAILSAEALEGSQEECHRLGVRHKALIEIRKLRQQLIKIINSRCPQDKPFTVKIDMKPPTDEEMLMLRQIVTASLTDNIAKRVDPVAAGDLSKGAYQSQKLKDYVYIDPGSILFKDEPEWVLYQEIVERKHKKYMQNVICVERNWLPRLANTYCHFTSVKEAEPRYDPATDSILILMDGTFSDMHWSLGKVEQPLPVNVTLYRYFAQFFLDGSVCPSLATYADKLLLSPSTMTKPWAKLQMRTEKLLNALIEYEVTSRGRLAEVWRDKSEYLLDEYLEWLPQFLHEKVQMNWPPS
ncbi:DEAD/DEAH box helicase [Loa loa]|uniref:RNA helicase n=1 Tax=Loa loa TaxID=7209 RepID=A0A1S0U5S3_LOALO|nr:DEAD/DEAH box helicase [Loa loa]EFO25661.2 DEAD/DEAH box helicase [Loa loa]